MPAAAERSQEKQSEIPRWEPNDEEKADLHALNAAVDRMRNVTAPDPYVLTIPQDVEPRYHHNYRAQAIQWLDNTPFSQREHESIQYQTFFYHEHGKDMYVLHNSRPEEPTSNGGTILASNAGTGSNTPNPGPKKKISLNAYKKQKIGGTATPDGAAVKSNDTVAKQEAIKAPIERVKAETEDMLASVAENEEFESLSQDKETASAKKDLKRKRDEVSNQVQNDPFNSNDGEKAIKAQVPNDAPVAKKVRKTPPSPSKDGKLESNPSRQEERTRGEEGAREEDRMPPRLSPGMPLRLSPLHRTQSPEHPGSPKTPSLPKRLSPTLPENIQNTLKARAHFHSTSVSSNLSTSSSGLKDGKLTPGKRPDGITKRKSPVPRNGFRANSSSPAVRSDAEDRRRPVTPAPELTKDEATTVAKTLKENRAQKPSLTVKLKFKKARREHVQRILKMPPKPEKPLARTKPEPEPEAETEPLVAKSDEPRNGERKQTTAAKGVAQKIKPVERSQKAEEKDAREEAVKERPPSRSKLTYPEYDKLENTKQGKATVHPVKNPSTPPRPHLQSPLANTSSQKSHLTATPTARKDLSSAAMRRDWSQDSMTVNTPVTQSSTKTLKQQTWETEQKRLEALGRELKHESSAHINASSSGGQSKTSRPSTEQKLAAVKSVESLLCYLLAFTCADEALRAADPKQPPTAKPWRTLLGFFGFVKRSCEPFPALCGLACALGMSFNSRILTIATQYPTDTPDVEKLLQTQAALQRAANDVDAKLDVDTLQEVFPRAWNERTKGSLPTAEPEPGKMGGPFKLPLGLVTTPLRAARAGHTMLTEWAEKEELDYHLRLKL